MEISKAPIVNTGLLIRRPVGAVFEAFVDPEVTTKFWFSRSSGRVESGKSVRWYWDIYNVSAEVRVNELMENRHIVIDWGDDDRSTVEWTFEARTDDTTYVRIVNKGFTGNGDDVVGKALDSAGGFALVLAAAKAWLEHDVELNVVADRL